MKANWEETLNLWDDESDERTDEGILRWVGLESSKNDYNVINSEKIILILYIY